MRLEPCGDRAGQAPDDSTVIRTHHHAAGAKGGLLTRGSWPFESGFPIRIHLRVNGDGLAMRTRITPGQTSDHTGYDLVMADTLPQAAVLVAGRGYESVKFLKISRSATLCPCVWKTVHRTVF